MLATPKMGLTRCLLRTGASSSMSASGCGGRRRFPKGECLRPDMVERKGGKRALSLSLSKKVGMRSVQDEDEDDD